MALWSIFILLAVLDIEWFQNGLLICNVTSLTGLNLIQDFLARRRPPKIAQGMEVWVPIPGTSIYL